MTSSLCRKAFKIAKVAAGARLLQQIASQAQGSVSNHVHGCS
jgi:hypothetical protein